MPSDRRIAVIGLGYVGLPVAVAFAQAGSAVIGFDINSRRIEELRAGKDRTREVDAADLRNGNLTLHHRPGGVAQGRFLHRHGADADRRRTPARPYCAARRLRDRRRGAEARRHRRLRIHRLSGRHRRSLRPGTGESVGPDRRPRLHRRLFARAHQSRRQGSIASRPSPRSSPARTRARSISSPSVYGSVVKAGIHRAPSIKVAEAAKVIENTQRDINIALMNELSRDLPRAGHRHRRSAGGRRHQMELPAFHARAWSAATASASIPTT